MLNHELRSIPSRVLRAAPALAIFLAILLAAPSARAQLNTSGLRGTVTTTDGAPVAGALVTLVHVPSSNQKIANTNASGAFAFTGLRVGGPYSVTIYAEGYEPAGLNNIYLSIGKNESVAVTVKASSEILEITVGAVHVHRRGRRRPALGRPRPQGHRAAVAGGLHRRR
jgi:hypothetical protein